jgi:hypothetical protein
MILLLKRSGRCMETMCEWAQDGLRRYRAAPLGANGKL